MTPYAGSDPELENPRPSSGAAMELVRDWEVPVTVRFGSTRMLLRDLKALSEGSTIEFPDAREDQVEVLVNGRVVARGSAITVQGCYGVEISEVIGSRAGASGPDGREAGL